MMQISDFTSAQAIAAIKLMLPFAVIVVGWFVASNLQDNRERRKEIRSLVDETKRCIQDSYKLTLEYYSKSNKTPINSLSSQIKFQNMLISQYFIVLNQAGLKTGGSTEIIQYHKMSTGDVFETSDFRTRIDDIEWKSGLTSSAYELLILLEKRYFSQFKLKGIPSQSFG